MVHDTLDDYVLHPSIMDGVLQAASALIVDPTRHSGRAPLPFALESMNVFSGCKGEMVAWARYSAGSQPADAVAKLDIDVCDADGNVCVRMRGFSSRVAGAEIGDLLAAPEWISAATAPNPSPAAEERHHVLLCNLAKVDEHELEAVLGKSSVRILPLAGRFHEVSLACFEHLQAILKDRSPQRVLVQVVVPRDDITLAGVSALLKSATRKTRASWAKSSSRTRTRLSSSRGNCRARSVSHRNRSSGTSEASRWCAAGVRWKRCPPTFAPHSRIGASM